ncbi:hypothetical protein [Blautia wexlerae]|uniref:hypothetical protein n=1 Tax=Blautia wexlerae TaxID=418240 RepID=UPI0034A4A983
MNSTEQNNISFLLKQYKDIVKNDDGSFRLAHRCIPGTNNSYVKFVDTGVHSHNELEHECYCYKCKYCELNYPFDFCLLRTTLENSSIKVPTHYVANCDAYDPIEYLNIIRDKSEMINFIEMVQQCFGCPEYCEKYFGFSPNVDDDTGKVLETVKEYYERGGEFANIPDKYPCVIYFPIDNINIHEKLEWIYIGEEC